MPEHEFAITAVGMSTAVGWDAASSCSSFRAGISRAAELDYADYFSEDEADIAPIVGHVASVRAVECEGLGKMVALGIDALKDLFEARNKPTGRAHPATGLFLALPNYSLRHKSRVDANAAPSSDGPSDASFTEEFEADEDLPGSLDFVSECNQYLSTRLFRAAGIDANITINENVYGDHLGVFLCMRSAMRALRSGIVERCIVGGIDSLIEPDTLFSLLGNNRLKTPAVACGLVPGEAAVFLELATAEHAGSVAAYVTEPEVISDSPESRNTSVAPGSALAMAIQSVLSQTSRPPGLVIGDLNGEYERAREWGYAINKLARQFPELGTLRSWYPAETFGETGCATAGLSIGVALQAFQRRYALTDTVLIWSSSEDDLKGALLLHSPQ